MSYKRRFPASDNRRPYPFLGQPDISRIRIWGVIKQSQPDPLDERSDSMASPHAREPRCEHAALRARHYAYGTTA
jgi:hypothetical protein